VERSLRYASLGRQNLQHERSGRKQNDGHANERTVLSRAITPEPQS
jgi:hypothetical protein